MFDHIWWLFENRNKNIANCCKKYNLLGTEETTTATVSVEFGVWSVSKVQVSKLSLSAVVAGGCPTPSTRHNIAQLCSLLGSGPFSALLVNVFQDFIQLIILTLQLNHSTDIFLPKKLNCTTTQQSFSSFRCAVQ